MKKLSDTKKYIVRCNVADNPNTSLEVLNKLRKDSDEEVAEAAYKNYNSCLE